MTPGLLFTHKILIMAIGKVKILIIIYFCRSFFSVVHKYFSLYRSVKVEILLDFDRSVIHMLISFISST